MGWEWSHYLNSSASYPLCHAAPGHRRELLGWWTEGTSSVALMVISSVAGRVIRPGCTRPALVTVLGHLPPQEGICGGTCSMKRISCGPFRGSTSGISEKTRLALRVPFRSRAALTKHRPLKTAYTHPVLLPPCPAPTLPHSHPCHVSPLWFGRTNHVSHLLLPLCFMVVHGNTVGQIWFGPCWSRVLVSARRGPFSAPHHRPWASHAALAEPCFTAVK